MSDFSDIRLIRSSRKEHVCYLCGQKIGKGESYRLHVGRFDGGFYSNTLHMDCHMMVEAYWSEADLQSGEGWDDYLVMEFVNQWLHEDGYEVPELKRDAVRKWLELYGSR